MSWFTDLFAGGVDKVVSSVGEAADRLITSDEERLTLKNELVLIQTKATLDAQKQAGELEQKLEEQISERWKSDMSSDDPWAKKVRPFSLVYLLVFMSLIIIVDSASVTFEVKEAYITLIETLLVTVFIAYFGSRGVEKVVQLRRK